jgi:hypothetical protein
MGFEPDFSTDGRIRPSIKTAGAGSTAAWTVGFERPIDRAMIRGPFRLRAIALITAYAVALQGLLAAFVPVAAALPSGMLCSGQVMDGPAEPAGHEPSCASSCAMLGGIAGPLPPDLVVAVQLASPAHDLSWSAAPPVAPQRGRQTARAPPLV